MIQEILSRIPAVNTLIAGISSNSTRTQQIARLGIKPEPIDNTEESRGVFSIENNEGGNIRTYLTYRDGKLSQLVKVSPDTDLKIKLNPLDGENVRARYLGINILFEKNSDGSPELQIKTNSNSGTSVLTTDATLIPLIIEVVSFEQDKKPFKGIFQWLYGLIFGI